MVPRADGIPKVTGEFAYSSDLVAPGMLWGHTLRSPHAHALILAVAFAVWRQRAATHPDRQPTDVEEVTSPEDPAVTGSTG